jgi:hypothetical protein
MFPYLHVRLGTDEWTRVAAPEELGERDWLLGVVAVQLAVEGGKVTAQARAHLTGQAEPVVSGLAHGSVLHVTLVENGGIAPVPPKVEPPELLHGAVAALALYVDGTLKETAYLAPAGLTLDPPPRAFGHVFCRFVKDGSFEPGYDVTHFLSIPQGEKYERAVAEALVFGQTISYGIAISAA